MVKITFGNNKKIRLTSSEYNELISIYGRETALTYIQKVDDFIKSTGRVYPSHFITIKEWLAKDGFAEVEKAYGLRQIFIEFNGNNKEEIIKLRKEWKPICPQCKSEMTFYKMIEHTFNIGETPSSIAKCVGCANYCCASVDEKGGNGKMLYLGYDDTPTIFEKTWEEILKELETGKNGK